MIVHVSHLAPNRPKTRRTRLSTPAHMADRARPPAMVEETPHSVYLRFWLSRQAARHAELLRTIAAAPKPRQ